MNSRDPKYRNQILTGLGKIPPQAVDLEEAIIGALMLESSAVRDNMVILFRDMFYKESHQVIFGAIRQLYDRDEKIDILTVTYQLKNSGELEIIGGPYYITQLTERVGSASNIEYHIRIVTQMFLKREIIRLCSEHVGRGYEQTEDIFELHNSLENGVSKINQYIIGKDFEYDLSSEVDEALKNILTKREAMLTGVDTGNNQLNELTGGWNKTNLITLCARPGMGKTTRALEFALKAAEREPVAFFSLEMSKRQLMDKSISRLSNVNGGTIRKQSYGQFEMASISDGGVKLKNLNLYINDRSGISPNYIKNVCRERKRKNGLGLVVIDYLQLLHPNESVKGRSREQEIASISLSLKNLAKELDVPVIALSQLSRECEKRPNKRPIQSDLRDSGSIEQDSDLILALYRPCVYYKEKEKDRDYKNVYMSEDDYLRLSEMLVLKNRHGSAPWVLEEKFYGGVSKFEEVRSEAKHYDAPAETERITPPKEAEQEQQEIW